MSDKTSTIIIPNNKNYPRRTVVIAQNLSTLGSSPFYVDLGQYQVDFVPNKVIVRQLLYSNIAGTDTGIFLLYSSLANGNIGCVYTSSTQAINQNPGTEIIIYSFQRQITFSLGIGSSGNAPTGYLAMTLEFVRE